jgi:hypothetical protein
MAPMKKTLLMLALVLGTTVAADSPQDAPQPDCQVILCGPIGT